MTRFPVKKYASLELNQVAFPKTGMVVSQVPLGAAFTTSAPCENGMWVVADKAAGTINPPAAVTDKPLGIVYTAEKEYDSYNAGLMNFGRKIEGDYPRVGILGLGDTVTTNCLQYDETTYATFAALESALNTAAAGGAELYVIPVAGSPVPALAASKGTATTYGKVVKYYTMPNGEAGVKYQIVGLE